MSIPFVNIKAQDESIREELDRAIKNVIDGDLLVGGEVVKAFEKNFASYLGVEYCVGCGNGSDAIEIALKALGIGRGDEVIVPAFSWISTASAVSNVGAEPIFVDVLVDERTINPALIESKITDRTKGIIPVHLYGLPARMNEIKAIADRHDIFILEDCAQAHGAEIKGQKVGSFGDIGTFSFYPSKNLGAYGDGGAIVTDDSALHEKVKRLSNQGQLEKHDHELLGRNSRLDSIQAAILSTKLSYLDQWNDSRIASASKFEKELDGIYHGKIPTVPREYKHVFHLYVIESENRDSLKANLEMASIGCAIHYPTPLPFLPIYKYQEHSKGDFPVAERLSKEVLSLPMYSGIEDRDVKRVTQIMKKHFGINSTDRKISPQEFQ